MVKKALIFGCLLFVLSACQFRSESPQHWRHLAMGTWVDITIYDQTPINEISPRLAKLLDDAHQRWHAWHPSELSRINESFAQGRCVQVAPTTAQLIRLAKQLWQASDGLFDAGIGQLLKLWGFQRENMLAAWQPPEDKEINDWLASHPSIHDVYFVNNRQLCSRNPKVSLDFGGFGKGFILQLVSQSLSHLGITNHMVNGGGDIIIAGQPPHRPWRIAIQNPFAKEKVLATIELSGKKSIFTSGTYERHWQHQGITYHHILDPRTARPAQGTVSVTVIGDDPVWMDAAATAILIAGPKCAARLADKMRVHAWLVIDHKGVAYLNTAMKNWIEWVTPPQSIKLIKQSTACTR